MQDLRLVHVSPTFLPHNIGGGERYPWELAKALSKYHHVTLVVIGDKAEAYTNSDNLDIRVCKSFHVFRSLDHYNPLSVSFLTRFVDADIVHVHQFNTLVSNASILFSKLIGKRVCVTDYGGGGRNLAQMLKLGHLVDCFMTLSNFSKKQFAGCNRRTETIYGGANEKFHPRPLERENRVLFVGRALPHKGIDYLVEAIQDLDVKLRLVVVPKNPEYLDLLRRLDKRGKIEFRFSLRDDDKLAVEYCTAMVTVLPSVYVDCHGHTYSAPELLGLCLIESMACGTPVICTNVGGMPEIVEDGKTGFVVPPNDPTALRDRISLLLNHPDIVRAMGASAAKRSRENFSWDAVARKVIMIYQSLLNST